MSTEVHLLSDYKKDFVAKRFLQTFIGGIRLPSVPWYVKLLQLVIFGLPLMGIVPYYVINDPSGLSSLLLGIFGMVWALLLQLLGRLAHWRAAHLGNTVLHLSSNLLDEENEVQFEGLFCAKTWTFLIPPKKHWINVLFHSLMAGLLFLACSQYLLKSTIQEFLGSKTPFSELVISLAILSICQAFHSLVIVSIPESAVFRAHDNLERNYISRPIHVIFVTIPYWTLTHLVSQSSVLHYTTGVSYVIVCCLPILWLLGVLPPFEPFILWLTEQLQIFGLGGTPSCTLGRSITQFLLSLLHFGILHIFHDDKGLVVKICGVSGYILSLDILGLSQIGCLLKKESIETTVPKVTGKVSSGKVSQAGKIVQSRKFIIIKECLTHVFFFTLNTLLVILNTSVMEAQMLQHFDPVNNVTIAVSYSRRPNDTLLNIGWITLAGCLGYTLFNESSKAYCCFGLLRSPLFRFCSTHQLTVLIWQHTRSLLFNFVMGLWMTYYVILLVNSDYYWSENETWYTKCLEITAMIRAFRWIWQSPESALIEMSGLHLYFVLIERDHWFISVFSRPVQLMLIGLIRDRIKEMWEKVYLIIGLAVSAIEDRPSKSCYAGLLFQVNLLFFPYLILLVIVSSIISAPILAVFTLPIFFISYPRPIRFWPDSHSCHSNNQGADAVYYQQMIPPLLTALQKALRAGRLGSLLPGQHLLARHEDRTVWIQLLEKGNGYVYYQAKGLELQETSCHSLEVTRIDDIFQDTFDHQTKVNHFAFHTLTPLVSLPVHMYASSKNVLTGVIESPETLTLIAKMYKSTLVWYILKTLLKLNIDKVKQPSNEHAKSPELKHLPYVESYETVNEMKQSSSIEAVNLDSWPSSEPSPDEVTKKQQHSAFSRRSAYFLRPSNSEESIPSIGSLDDQVPKQPTRKGLLPPIQLEPILPGGINTVNTPEILRRKSDTTTIISPRRSIISNGSSNDDTLAGILTPPQDWLISVEEVHRSFLAADPDEKLNLEWLSCCLKHYITEEIVRKYDMGNKELAVKVLLKDIILTRKLQQVQI